MKATMAEMVAAVKAHAVKNYEKDGWDYVVECYTDKDIAGIIGTATTVAGAIREMGAMVSILDDRRRDVQAEIF